MTIRVRQEMCYRRNNGAPSRNHCCRGKAITITCSECVCVCVCVVCERARARATLFIQNAMRMHRIILSLYHKRHDFKRVLNTKRVF
jgi:hypothetical protein